MPGMASKATASVTIWMTMTTPSASRLRRWARMTLDMLAFQASSSSAGAKACSRPRASGSTSVGVFTRPSSGPAASSAMQAPPTPSQVLAPTTARATASAWSRRPAPRAWVTATLTPAPMTRNSTNSAANTWLAMPNAAPLRSDSRAASAVPMTPMPMPSSSSSSSGQVKGKSRGRPLKFGLPRRAGRRVSHKSTQARQNGPHPKGATPCRSPRPQPLTLSPAPRPSSKPRPARPGASSRCPSWPRPSPM
mmetsp:Transcript_6590/g.27259  ORF Transcript_6590/g.27259 Transcript_6590/m.27259 type:complete len:250 (-) Transcript_6590:1617-2366(-)